MRKLIGISALVLDLVGLVGAFSLYVNADIQDADSVSKMIPYGIIFAVGFILTAVYYVMTHAGKDSGVIDKPKYEEDAEDTEEDERG